ncbi:hypothetical protein PQJ75_01380 [Rhodoplanes sp. TEM]|uniref:Uncharacterized protein n=1 Tax=Rhodoplanes tepidamans TaxID=200616 RepID=A0ABT5J9S0_RHOTP|nr:MULTISPECIES: hypothetical protein [Rhodoplanes]MDC7786258.1 hypothetical protein [Rhodoplanes tepidamans]MDC7982371.1 hypothetical protein [Rhodoplanes sp. TEM]MDQ0355057.1 hypothetical protein [Rhodoplanes tepidamans]
MAAEDRVALRVALDDAVRNPHKVGDLKLRFLRIPVTDEHVVEYRFRFGYANYVIFEVRGTFFLYDAWLDDDLYFAAE